MIFWIEPFSNFDNEFFWNILIEIFLASYEIFMGNQRNWKRNYDRIRDIEARREYSRNYYKRKNEEHLNIERENQTQLEVEGGL